MAREVCDATTVKEFYETHDVIYCKRYRCSLTKAACDNRRKPKDTTALSIFRYDMYAGCMGCPHNVAGDESEHTLGRGAEDMKQELTHEEWLATEGVEHATRAETLAQECQKKRIAWLVDNVEGRFVEIGCNYGYISAEICEKRGNLGIGIDINIDNIVKAQNLYRGMDNLYFMCRDIVNDNIYVLGIDTILLPDVLEHIPYDKVGSVLHKVCDIAKRKILITLPWETTKRTCFKHSWLVDKQKVDEIIDVLREHFAAVEHTCDGDFIYIVGSTSIDKEV